MRKAVFKHWHDPVSLLLGLWLLASPWVLKYHAEASLMWSAVVLGGLVAATAVLALLRAAAWKEWANVLLGIAIVVSPWVPANPVIAAATVNAVTVGGVVATLAAWALATDKNISGWWNPAT